MWLIYTYFNIYFNTYIYYIRFIMINEIKNNFIITFYIKIIKKFFVIYKILQQKHIIYNIMVKFNKK